MSWAIVLLATLALALLTWLQLRAPGPQIPPPPLTPKGPLALDEDPHDDGWYCDEP